MQGIEEGEGGLPEAYHQDFLAWYLLSGSHLYAVMRDRSTAAPRALERAETALRRSMELNDGFARGHRNLARICLLKAQRQREWNEPGAEEDLRRARRELARAKELDPGLHLAAEDGELARLENSGRSWLALAGGGAALGALAGAVQVRRIHKRRASPPAK
jgi:hypothetical protein